MGISCVPSSPDGRTSGEVCWSPGNTVFVYIVQVYLHITVVVQIVSVCITKNVSIQ